MDRYHIVVSNYNRIESFVDNFHRINNFNKNSDKVYVMDCSPEETWEKQLEQTKMLSKYGLMFNSNLFFIRRRNWNLNHGAQLDYIKAIIDGHIAKPTYTAFVQEHYFDLNNYVKEDTIPENSSYDLDLIEAKFSEDREVGCVFLARNGIRVSLTNPVISKKHFLWGDENTVANFYKNSVYKDMVTQGLTLKGANKRCFFIDGGNFIIKTDLYVNWFNSRKHLLVKGDGSYAFCHVWEIRLGCILYKQNIKWLDIKNNISYKNVEELYEIQNSSCLSLSKQWYDNRVWFFFYGRDMINYLPFPLKYIRKYLREYIRNYFAISSA